MCKKRKFKSKAADSSGVDVTGGQLLMRSLILRRLLLRHGLGSDEQYVGVLLPPSVGGLVANAALTLDQRITVKQDLTGAAVRPSMPSIHVESESPGGGIEADEDTFALAAPLVGTFYRRPSPDAEPFVSPGDVVNPGDTLGLIEAMKVMNEINAEASGRVRRVLADDGEAVEYGQLLFVFDRP